MAFSRQKLPHHIFSEEELASNLVSIGILLGASPSKKKINIEDTLFFSSLNAIRNEDFRILSLLTTWLGVHYRSVNVDRLCFLIASDSMPIFRAYWASIALWLHTDLRFSKIKRLYKGPKLNLLQVGTQFQISRHGEDDRFKKSFLKVPANLLRDRKSDILSPAQLACKMRTYYNRMLIGPSYRADMWSALENNPNLSPAELAREAYGSFATAWKVKQDWLILHA